MAKGIRLSKAIYGKKVFNTQRELEYYRCYKRIKLDRRMVDDIHQAVGRAEGYIPCESLEEELDAWQYLIDTGMVYSLPYMLSNHAQFLIAEGLCKERVVN